ncbi:13453_t:CDS:2, partial [Funneliformis caledonium]
IFKNCGKSKIEKKNRYKLATLGEIVNSKCLPAGYSTSVSPLPNAYDHCKKKLDDGEVLVCGHGYHFECYQKLKYSCHYYEEYYKCRIYNNVNSFLKRLKKSPNILTTKEKEGENVEDIANEDDEKIPINKNPNKHLDPFESKESIRKVSFERVYMRSFVTGYF